MLQLAFLWHMHQPDYRDEAGVMGMPWVFLHAIKDYYDMPWTLSRHPRLKATFNLTPSLIEQIGLYRDPCANDRFLRLWERHPSELGSAEREWVVKICTSCQFETMVRPLPRLAELYGKEAFDDASMIDLEVLFVLAWCGTYLRRHDATVSGLLARGKGFDQRDKTALLEALTAFVGSILPYYARLQEEERIAVSTTPYNHPILPLLFDMGRAAEANPDTPLPENPCSLESDAREQVTRAIALYEQTFGRKPGGFWPAEGAVDETSAALYRDSGLGWIATDEALLFRSIGSEERSALFRRWRCNGLYVGFRDHGLSDLIGFDYRHRDAKEAANHFIGRLEAIRDADGEGTVHVILDGENAWEFYESNGFPFFEALYSGLAPLSWCTTVTMDALSELEAEPLPRLSPGSWIYGDFSTWVGHREKNRAWELLFQAYRDHRSRGERFDEATEAAIRSHFLALECSDWYWWYGDDHMTTFAVEFDALFRGHLIALYRRMRMNPPSDLFEPILEHVSTASFMVRPQSAIRPRIDGRSSSFFEWIGAGRIDESKLYSTMERRRGPITMIRYGYDEAQNLYISLEGAVKSLRSAGYRLHLIIEEHPGRITVPLDGTGVDEPVTVRIGHSIEMALPRTLLGDKETIHLRIEIDEDERIVQTLPGFGALRIEPAIDYRANWFV